MTAGDTAGFQAGNPKDVNEWKNPAYSSSQTDQIYPFSSVLSPCRLSTAVLTSSSLTQSCSCQGRGIHKDTADGLAGHSARLGQCPGSDFLVATSNCSTKSCHFPVFLPASWLLLLLPSLTVHNQNRTKDLTAWSDTDYQQQQKKGKCIVGFFSKAFNRTHLFLSIVKIYTCFLYFFFFLRNI